MNRGPTGRKLRALTRILAFTQQIVDKYADLRREVVFNPKTVIDLADFEHPTEHAAGIEAVFVNGRAVWQDGSATGARPGHALKRQDLQAMKQGERQ